MKKLKTALLLCAMVIALTSSTNYVYICTGGYATKYHSSASCRGLNRCGGDIIKVSEAEARNRGRTPCKICY